MSDRRETWLSLAEAQLPSKDRVLERNEAITGTYARLYLRQRERFKWAGMAAFASFQVGLALQPLGFGLVHHELAADLELIRETNNAVYADIAWAHFAYESRGMQELHDCLDGLRGQELLLNGFQQIDRATRMGRVDPVRSWYGNALLLEHEQHHTVQPRFDRFKRLFGAALTWATMLDFDGDHRQFDRKTISAFSVFMLTQGLHVLLLTRSLPNVGHFDQRWHWIERSLLRKWKQVESSDRDLVFKMERFARNAPPLPEVG